MQPMWCLILIFTLLIQLSFTFLLFICWQTLWSSEKRNELRDGRSQAIRNGTVWMLKELRTVLSPRSVTYQPGEVGKIAKFDEPQIFICEMCLISSPLPLGSHISCKWECWNVSSLCKTLAESGMYWVLIIFNYYYYQFHPKMYQSPLQDFFFFQSRRCQRICSSRGYGTRNQLIHCVRS